MKKKPLYTAWLCLYIVTVILGSLVPSGELMKAVMILLAICFFIPPAVLLYQGIRGKDRKQVILLRRISAISLGLTFLLALLNFLSLGVSESMGDMLYALLIVVSAPMVCGQYWVVSMFAWACLLMTGLMYCPKK